MASDPRSTVVLVRAWFDDDGVRGRVLTETADGDPVVSAAASLDELCAQACAALKAWSDAWPTARPG